MSFLLKLAALIMILHNFQLTELSPALGDTVLIHFMC